MNIAGIKYNDVADGPGVRTTVFVSGCRRHCPGCQNPETWDFDFGERFNWQTEQMIIDSLKPYWIQGLTICGGEPMEPENQEALIPFLKRIRQELPGKDIWLYTGYRLESVSASPLLQLVDVVVDGPFIEEQKDAGLTFRGSRNQRIIHLEGGKPICG